MGPAIEMSGGSAANTIVGVASLGARAALCRQGQGRPDRRACIRMTSARRGVAFETKPRVGRSRHRLLLHPGDAGRRAHHEHLSRRGAGADARRYRRRRRSRRPRIVYLEGYLWDPKNAKEAFVKASTIAHGAGRQVALTLSDSFCVDRYRGEFLDLMRKGTVDLVFANEAELHALYQTADFDTALTQLRSDAKLARRHPQREGLRGGLEGRRHRGAGVSDRQASWIPPAPAICSPPDFCSAWCAAPAYEAAGRLGALRGGRSDPAHRRAAAGVAEGFWRAERVAGLGLCTPALVCEGSRNAQKWQPRGLRKQARQIRFMQFCRQPLEDRSCRSDPNGAPRRRSWRPSSVATCRRSIRATRCHPAPRQSTRWRRPD